MARYNHLRPYDRVYIEKALRLGISQSKMARSINRSRSTIKRELERNGFHDKDGIFFYDAKMANTRANLRKIQPKHIRGPKQKPIFPPSINPLNLFAPVNRYRTIHKVRGYCSFEYFRKKFHFELERPKELRRHCPFEYHWKKIWGRIEREKQPAKYRYQPEGYFKRDRSKRVRYEPKLSWLALYVPPRQVAYQRLFKLPSMPHFSAYWTKKEPKDKDLSPPWFIKSINLPKACSKPPEGSLLTKPGTSRQKLSRLREPQNPSQLQHSMLKPGKTMPKAENFHPFFEKRVLLSSRKDCLF